MENYIENIGKRVQKCSISKDKHHKIKPFKSGFKINTVKDVVEHPILHIPAYTFIEDDSYVECRRCEVISKYTEFQNDILKKIEENTNNFVITAEQQICKIKSE